MFSALVSALRPERRALEKTFVDNPAQWLIEMFGSRAQHSGVTVTPATSMQSAAVFACVRVSAETMGSLPLKVYRRLDGGGKVPAPEHPLYSILRGNFYSEIVRDGAGRVSALWPLHPDRVTVERGTSGLEYVVIVPSYGLSAAGQPIRSPGVARLAASQVLHVRGLSSDGVLGLSPIQLTAEAIGLSLAAEAYGAAFFGRGANPGGVIERPATATKLSEETVKRLREQWQELYGGLSNAHRVAILEDGMSWKQIAIQNNHAQFLETRQYQVGDIARIFRVPGVMIGHDDKTATYASAEQFFLSFVVHHVRPWAVRWEQAIALKLLTPRERLTHFSEFVVDGLLRGDLKSRYDAYWIGRQGGWLSANDIRGWENMNRIDGGDVYWAPVNMVPADQLGKQRVVPPQALPMRSGMMPTREALLTEDGIGRAIRKEIATVRQAAERHAGDVGAWRRWVDEFYSRHAAYISEALKVDLDIARRYAHEHRAALLGEGVTVLERWDIEAAGELTELVGLGEVAS